MRQITSIVLIKAFFFAILIMFAASPAQAYLHPGVPSSGPCQFGNAYADGCPGANPNGDFQNTGFLTSAIQSGQSSILFLHPQLFNIPCVDYACGRDKTHTLKDPTTNIPTGATYSATGSGAGGPLIQFNNSASGNIDVEDLDLSGASSGGIGCIELRVASNPTTSQTVTIKNNKFVDGQNCDAVGAAPILLAGGGPRTIQNNDFDGTLGNGTPFILDNTTSTAAPLLGTYNVFLHTSGRIAGSSHGGPDKIWRFNYDEGLVLANTQHGEWDLWGGTPYAMGTYEFSYNTGVQDQNNPALAGYDVTAWFFISTGNVDSTTATNTIIVGNTLVSNKQVDGTSQNGDGLLSLGFANVGNLNISNNYYDPTGGFFCALSGQISNSNTASSSGNTVTFTGTHVSPVIGNKLYGPGFTSATITAGSGNVWTFDGPPQTVASVVGWQVTPGWTGTPTISNNVNLTDGSAITMPLPTLNGTCNNHI